MKTIALVSGGKDSLLAVMAAMQYGHTPAVIANIAPSSSPSADLAPGEDVNEVDSYMFQTVGHEVVAQIAQCMELPLRRTFVYRGQSKDQSLSYSGRPPADDEVEQLFRLLKAIKEDFPEVEGVTSGAILSNYQRNRVEIVCERLGLVSLAYLWQRRADEILDMADELRVEAILVKTASVGLHPRKLLGKSLREVRPLLKRMDEQYGAHMAGEGGEFETIVLDCPLYKSEKLIVTSLEVIMVDENDYSPSGHCVLGVTRAPKDASEQAAGAEVLAALASRGGSSGLSFPSDGMAALPDPTKLTAAPVDARDTGGSDEATAISAALEECSMVTIKHFAAPADAGGESLFAEVAQWLGEALLSPIACQLRGRQEARMSLLEAYKRFAPRVSPPTLSFTLSDSPQLELTVVAAAADASVQKRVLHAQGLSCWAAGVPGRRYSQAASVSNAREGLLLCSGITGLDPVSGRLASQTEAGEAYAARLTGAWRQDANLRGLAVDFAYAFANAMAYLSFFDSGIKAGDLVLSVVITVGSSRDACQVPALWLWCVRAQSSLAGRRDPDCVIASLPECHGRVQVTLIRTSRAENSDSD